VTAVFVGDFEPGTPEWHAARAKGIGGSEIAAVLGLSPFESRFSLWHRKMQLSAPVVENDVMYWGNRLEAVIRDEFTKRHNDFEVDICGTWCASGRPWQVANPDGLVWEMNGRAHSADALLEVKTAYNDDGWGEEGTEEIPVYYRTQCLWYLDVFGLQVCHVAVLISGSDYREYRVEYSRDEAVFMRERAREFLDTLTPGQRPAIDSHAATYQVVREMHPEIDDVNVDVPEDIAEQYLVANADYKAAEAEKHRAAATLADFMGSARKAFYRGEQIASRVPGRSADAAPILRATPAKKTPGLKVQAA
jgi:putative phage-type endonuclease